MNILKRELKFGRKAFVLWSVGLFFMMFAGMAKYTGFSGDASVMAVFDQMPKMILAVFGMVGIDIATLGGYYAILVYYGMLCASIYAVHLGSNVVNREAIDQTYEFIFTKPRTRSYVLNLKFLSAAIYITLFCLLSYLFSVAAVSTLSIENTIMTPILLYSIAMWLISMLFCTLSIFLATVIKKPEIAIRYSNLLFVAAFVLGMVYDMLENNALLRFFTPFKYFAASEMLLQHMNLVFIAVCVVCSMGFYLTAVRLFRTKDLQA